MPKLVAMVSLYNSGEWIQNRLTNLFESQSIQDMEVWCLNANSPDSRDDEIPRKFPIKYVKLDVRNTVYEAWNYIIKNSDSKYITNANTDDIVAPNCYKTLMDRLDSGYDFAYPSWYVTRIPNQTWSTLHDASPDGIPGLYCGDITRGGVGHFPMWRRSLHDKLGLLNTSFRALADAEWWARTYHKGNAKFCWVRQPLGCFLHRNGQNLWCQSITTEEWTKYHIMAQGYARCQ